VHHHHRRRRRPEISCARLLHEERQHITNVTIVHGQNYINSAEKLNEGLLNNISKQFAVESQAEKVCLQFQSDGLVLQFLVYVGSCLCLPSPLRAACTSLTGSASSV